MAASGLPQTTPSMKPLLTLAFLTATLAAYAQPGSEVWLLSINDDYGTFTLSDPKNISQNPGYDNQPSFLPDGSGLLYTSQQASGQTDIIRYELATGQKTQLTATAVGSEYSPTPMPDGKHFSTIRLDTNGLQLLYRYPLTPGGEPEVIIPEAVIGYHTWVNDTLLMAFVLGDPVTLQRCVTSTGQCTVADESIGRSLHVVPLNGAVSYVSKADTANWTMALINPLEGEGRPLNLPMDGTEDTAWRGNGSLFRTGGHLLYRWRPGADESWQVVADLTKLGITGTLTRLAFHPDGTHLALVASE